MRRLRAWVTLMAAFTFLAAPTGSAGAQGTGPGSPGFGYGETIAAPSGKEPQSKLWWNDGAWWGSLYSEAGPGYHLYQCDAATGQWRDTGVPLDDRPESRADVLWDGRRLYVASHISGNKGKPAEKPEDWARLYRFSYDRAARTYRLDPGFPVNVGPTKPEAMVLAKDSTGQLWVTYVEGTAVMVNRSQGSDLRWGSPFPLPATGAVVAEEDTAAVVPFAANKIGLMWTNRVDNAVYFAVHADCAPDDQWGQTQIALRAPGLVDDQLSLKSIEMDGRGWVYAAAKTAAGGGGSATPIWVLARQPSGRWNGYTFGVAREGHQRPSLVIDAERRDLYVFATAPSGVDRTAIYYKRARLPNPSFPFGLGAQAIALADRPAMEFATSTKQNLGSASGLMLLAADDITRTYAHSLIGLNPAATPPTSSSLSPTSGGCNQR